MIAIGCDHGGLTLKNTVLDHLRERGEEVKDFGVTTPDAVDYPDIAKPVAEAVASGECRCGILICGTGIGMSMAANKVRGVRAAVCAEHFSARFTRLHNDANVLCLGARVIGPGLALELVDLFLDTPFEGGRHAARVAKIAAIEAAQTPPADR